MPEREANVAPANWPQAWRDYWEIKEDNMPISQPHYFLSFGVSPFSEEQEPIAKERAFHIVAGDIQLPPYRYSSRMLRPERVSAAATGTLPSARQYAG